MSSDEETLTEWYGEKRGDGGSGAEGRGGGDAKEASVSATEISSPMTRKAEKVLGLKPKEIHVRREVDVESVISRGCAGWGGREGVGEAGKVVRRSWVLWFFLHCVYVCLGHDGDECQDD